MSEGVAIVVDRRTLYAPSHREQDHPGIGFGGEVQFNLWKEAA
jgi:hypothetical protein